MKSQIEGYKFHQLSHLAKLARSRPNQQGCLGGEFYGLQFRISNKIHFEPLMHALSLCEGLVESLFNLILSQLGKFAPQFQIKYDKPKFTEHKSSKHEYSEQKLKHKCKICKSEYTTATSLKHHISTVHENKVHFCPVCGKKFVQEYTLNLHMSTNCGNDGKRNKCSICDETFESRDARMDHIATKHEDIKLFQCSNCDYK